MPREGSTACRRTGGRAGGIGWLAGAVALLGAGTAVMASSRLTPTMHAWRDDARTVRDMAVGRSAFDPATIGRVLQAYAADSERIAASLNTRNADARDLQQHFLRFASDARTAQGDVGERSRLQPDLSRVFGDCRSCHDKFKN